MKTANHSRAEKNRFINLAIGIVLVTFGLLMPKIVNVENFKIYPDIYYAVENSDVSSLIYVSFKMVVLNTIRSLPHYVGAFFIRESLSQKLKNSFPFIGVMVVCLIIPMVYIMINQIYRIKYDFGVPAILLIILIAMFEKADFSFVNLPKKNIMIILLISAMQCLDLMPFLSVLPLGRGETSQDIKALAIFLNAEVFLQVIMGVLFLLLLFSSLLLYKMIIDENKLKLLMEERDSAQKALTEQRINAMKARTQLELQHLVHDLKTPLTAAQALIGVVQMDCDKKDMHKYREYLLRADSSLDNMSSMISEILYETKKSIISTKKIIVLLLAQISNMEYAKTISIDNKAPKSVVNVNEIRFIRALVNIIENAYHSESEGEKKVHIEVKLKEESVLFIVSDNGVGIDPSQISIIWDEGYTTKGSSGLGLSFVKQVVTGNNGTIEIISELNQGTTVEIALPNAESDLEENYGE